MSQLETALAHLAHEIRTPLNGILAFSELLSTADLPQRERQWAAAIKSAAIHLDMFATLVVDSVKANSSKLVLRNEPFRPRGLCETLAATLKARAEAKGLVAQITIADDLPDAVLGDEVRLRAALENLIDNAVKFTDCGQVGFFATWRPAPRKRLRLVFAISDNGIGLKPAEIRRVFKPFAQANRTIARRFGGAGLGLAFVSRMAKAMQGKLSVDSEPERGSTFTLSVLVDPVRATTPNKTTGASLLSVPSRRLRILCAEDNPYGRVVLNTILSTLGHAIDFVGNGQAAVESVRGNVYDLVLMDITLPGIDGIEATRRIRKLPGAAGRVPIIGISGRNSESEDKAARVAGMSDYVPKPVSAETLARALARL